MSSIQPVKPSQLSSVASVAAPGLAAQIASAQVPSSDLARQASVPAQSTVTAAAGTFLSLFVCFCDVGEQTTCVGSLQGNKSVWKTLGLNQDQLPSSQPLAYDAAFHGPASADRE